MGQSIVVLGARNLGGAIVDHFLGLGWNAAAVARSQETLEAVRARAALAISADASVPEQLASALELARQELGGAHALRQSGGGTLVQTTRARSPRRWPSSWVSASGHGPLSS